MKNKSKIKSRKVIGFILILVGIGMPLYGFTSLSISEMTRKTNYDNYLKKVTSQEGREEIKKISALAEEYNLNIDANNPDIVDPFLVKDFKMKYKTSLNPDTVISYLIVPALNLTEPIRLDASDDHLASGVAVVNGTSFPTGGLGKRSVIAGHRGWYSDIHFLHLDQLQTGDKVLINKGEEILTYKVNDKEIIEPDDWEKIKPVSTEDMITLLTCHPLATLENRLLINCVRAEEEKKEEKPTKTDEENKQENQKNPNPDEIEKNSIKPQKTNLVVEVTKIAIYLITVLLWSLFIIALYKLIRYLRQEKNQK